MLVEKWHRSYFYTKNKTMKKLVNVSLFILFIPIQYTYAFSNLYFNGEDSIIYLEIRGKAIIKEKTKDKIYKVELIENNKVIDSISEIDNQLFSFGLLRNRYYALKIYKTSYIPKLIIINTYIPERKYLIDYFIFDFETELISISEEEKMDEDTKDFPLAIVQFDLSKKGFNYNKQYSQNIKQQLNINQISKINITNE